LIHAVDKFGSFLRQFPLFPNAFLVGGAEDFFIIQLANQPESLGIIVGIIFLVLGILFQFFNFTAYSNIGLLSFIEYRNITLFQFTISAIYCCSKVKLFVFGET
ncbi:unnamed protein product, partial [Prunus brigantina]